MEEFLSKPSLYVTIPSEYKETMKAVRDMFIVKIDCIPSTHRNDREDLGAERRLFEKLQPNTISSYTKIMMEFVFFLHQLRIHPLSVWKTPPQLIQRLEDYFTRLEPPLLILTGIVKLLQIPEHEYEVENLFIIFLKLYCLKNDDMNFESPATLKHVALSV